MVIRAKVTKVEVIDNLKHVYLTCDREGVQADIHLQIAEVFAYLDGYIKGQTYDINIIENKQ